MKLSKRQQDILDFIKHEVKLKGYPPSVREIGEAVGLASSSTVHGHLARLESKGLIRRDPTKPRAIEVLQLDEVNIPKSNVINVPVIGKVTAGLPITLLKMWKNISLFQINSFLQMIMYLCLKLWEKV